MSHPNQIALDYAFKRLGATNTLYSKEVKRQRKHTAHVLDMMKVREQVFGVQPTPPATVIHHPRFFNPPLSCRDGRHQWETGFIMGIPRLKCKKCGRIVMKGSFEGTETKREIRERHVPKPTPLEPNFTVHDV